MLRLLAGLVASLSLALPSAGFAQAWPAKPIRILHHNPAGGPPDTQFRGLSQLVQQSLGQPLVIDSRPGGDGMIAAQAFVRADPDGYTLFLANGSVVFGNFATHRNVPYAFEDFVPIMLTGEFRSLVIVHPSVKANSFRDVLALAKAKPGAVTWSVGSSSPTTTSMLYVNWFKRTQGIEFLAVPYKSTTLALNAVVAGEVALTVYADGPAARLVQAGKLRAISTVSDVRSSFTPDVPTLKEDGVDLIVRSFYGLYAPRGTPDPLVQRINTEFRRFMDTTEFQEKYMKGLGMAYEPMSPQQFGAFVRKERDDFLKLTTLLGVEKQ